MADPAFVASYAQTENYNRANSRCTVSGATANNLLVGHLSSLSAISSLTYSNWTLIQSETSGTADGLFVYRIASGTSTDDLYVTWSGSSRTAIVVAEYSGIATTTPLEDSGENTTNISTSVTSTGTGSTTPVTANGLAVAGISIMNTGNFATPTIDGSFTVDRTASIGGTRPRTSIASLVYSSTSAISQTWTAGSGSGTEVWSAIGSFKVPAAAAGGSPPSTSRRRMMASLLTR